jgi:hypothetical protein
MKEVYCSGRKFVWMQNTGDWSMVNGQWSMVNGQWSMGHFIIYLGIIKFAVYKM